MPITRRKSPTIKRDGLGRPSSVASGVLVFHRDEQGAISLVSVFALLLLTMLLGMVMNVGRQVDRKVRMQNAADAATYSSGLMLARGMNSLAFTNHLLCDVFALTAYMREARDGDAASLTPDVLVAWNNMAPWLAASPFPKFARLGPAIAMKVPLEVEMVRSFTVWSAAASAMILPVLEQILADELI
ncbi:MAG TPA: pilus assembly protein TadG-related protein, partial [Pirellulales bacterium]|nr:pilus assembly protein TadG-related protein [Pirellulales bacterium]